MSADGIIKINTEIRNFWSKAHGWAPISAAELLESSMLNWQVDLSECLLIWTSKENLTEGELILAWANLGALLENSMKFFLCVFLEDYKKETKKMKKRKNEILPDEAMLAQLIDFYIFKKLFSGYHDFFEEVRSRRNAIHAFKKKDIGNFNDFLEAIFKYYTFLIKLDSMIPYPK